MPGVDVQTPDLAAVVRAVGRTAGIPGQGSPFLHAVSGARPLGKGSDARTVWAFREALKTHQLADVLFERLNQTLAGMGIRMKSGQIIDVRFVSAPVQRNVLICVTHPPIRWHHFSLAWSPFVMAGALS